ncbi:hypothetical protein LTR56_001938 [Elasticomyces elasticus]|nr:hypothetical protein LTR22_024794 [Elasticomyces elasticus]KAK3658082.1 hypothetical protein LTR56_001938 [Elasticomyces elasticus]KAK4923546.1 hypothetical protein LTR49_009259 [Elasticomyces elasticus]KAK5749776.1 hypothetical protein LTS12_020136 [Elasticomyces elasticus]
MLLLPIGIAYARCPTIRATLHAPSITVTSGTNSVTLAAWETATTVNGSTYTIPPSFTLYSADQASEIDLEALKLHRLLNNKNPQRDASTSTSTTVVSGSTSTTNVDLDVPTSTSTLTATPAVGTETSIVATTTITDSSASPT